MAGNHLTTELVLTTGAVEMMVVDYQCIMASLGSVAACYHTLMISTSDKARFPRMEHLEFHPHNARELAQELVSRAIANYPRRGEVYIPVTPVSCIGGFSVESVVAALGGTPQPHLPGAGLHHGRAECQPGHRGLARFWTGVDGCDASPTIDHGAAATCTSARPVCRRAEAG